jgi:chromosome segregation ATPase
MSKNNIIIALVVVCFLGVTWGLVKNKKNDSLESLVASMKAEASETAEHIAAATTTTSDAAGKALAEVKNLKAQNKKLLRNAEMLRETVASLKKKSASLRSELAEFDDGSQALEAKLDKVTEATQAKLANKTAAIATLEEAVVAAMLTIEQKNMELATAAEVITGLEDVKATLANNIDEYNAKSQELATEVEEYNLRVTTLEKALEERTRLLVGAGEELARTKLNMNVLLSKIGAQNNSLEILEKTVAVLEAKLAGKVVEIVVEEAIPVEEAPAN